MDRLGGIFGSGDHSDEPEFDGIEDTDDLDPPPSPVGQDERRMQVRAYNHWASMLGNRNFPAIDELDPESLEDFGPYSVLLDFSSGIEDPALRYLGGELGEECGAAVEMERLSDVPSRSLLSRITDHYMQILANQAPIGFEAEFVNQRGTTVLYRGILLPFSSDNQTIDFIYGVINWKEMADQQTADELLLALDQALSPQEALMNKHDDPSAANASEQEWTEADDVLDLGDMPALEDGEEDTALPVPAFGQDAPAAADDRGEPEIGAESLDDDIDWSLDPLALTAESLADAEGDAEEIDYSVDYGSQGLEDENEGDDVEDVVDPLADESVGQGLSALVTRGAKPKHMIGLPSAPGEMGEMPRPTKPAIPHAYEPSETADPLPFQGGEPFEPDEENAYDVLDETAFEDEGFQTDWAAETEEAPGDETVAGDEDPEGLYDTLAAARELAQVARTSEDRTRSALYEAVGRAYDFSLEAQSNEEDFAELMAENGLTMQDRAPMTPVVKLVFGADYDKTRLTEYAAVLSHAHRLGIERGTLSQMLVKAEGGLKGVVQAERRARKEEAGKPVEPVDGVRASLARKLRKIEPVAFADLDPEGPEFALVMVRRLPSGELVALGEIPEDTPLVERAGRKLVG